MFKRNSFTHLLLLLAILAIVLLAAAAPAVAAEIEVPCVEDASQALSAAVQLANDTPGHDVIRLEEGCSYRLTTVQAVDYGYNGLPVITEALTIEGRGARITRRFPAESNFRFMITADEVPLSIKDIVFSDGYAESPDGEPAHGGAVYARGSLVLDNVYFSYNRATGNGGAVYAYNGFTGITLTISNSFFEESYTALSGGAVYTNAHLIVNNSTFKDNGATAGDGGAINLRLRSAPTHIIQNSHFESNHASEGTGGAIYVAQANLTLIGTDFLYNTAKEGGALAFYPYVWFGPYSQPLTISDTYFLRNKAVLRGGAINAVGVDLLLERSRFVQNQGNETASTLYAEPYFDGGSRIINNLWVGDRSEEPVASIYIKQRDPESASTTQSVLHNTLVSPQGSVHTAIRVEQASAVNVIDNIVSGYDVAVWADSSGVSSGWNLYHFTGPTETGPEIGPIAPYAGGNNLIGDPLFVDPAADDYRLQKNSPAVDSAIEVGVSIDMLGLSRPQGVYYDRGAYEHVVVNSAPVASDDTYENEAGTSLSVPAPGVLANDNDADGDPLTAHLLSEPEHGSLTLNYDGSFTYIPHGDIGEDSFTYRTYDGIDISNLATVTITQPASNTPPTTSEDAYETRENTTLTVPSPGVLANDSDADGDALSAVLAAGPAHGSLILNDDATGGFTYTPDDGFSGQDSFSYKAFDGIDYSGESTVLITVVANTPPAAADDAYETPQNTTLTVPSPGVLANDSDADGDVLSAILAAGPAHGSLILNDDAAGGFTYIPDDGFSGQDSFTYRAYDGFDYSGQITVLINVVADDSSDFTLTATGYKVRGLQKADLEWSGATSATVDIYRDGVLIATTANDGFYTDNIDRRGSGAYIYQVYDAGTSIHSNEATVNY